MDYVSFGSITVPTKWLLLTAALLLSYFILKFHKNPPYLPIIFDAISNSLLIGLVVLKLSLLLIEPRLVISHPLSLLYFTGGEFGYWLGVAVAILAFFWETKKKEIPFPTRFSAFFFYSLYAYTIFHVAALFFNLQWEHFLSLLFSAVVFIWLFGIRKPLPYDTFSISFAFYQLVLVNVFQTTGSSLIYEYFFYAILILVMIWLKKFFNK